MSLNHLEAIPVDTHVYQIAKLHYLPGLKSVKNVTAKMYNEIGDKFREVYGELAGWAQTVSVGCGNLMLGFLVNDRASELQVLFCSDLAKFKENAGDGVAKKRRKKS